LIFFAILCTISCSKKRIDSPSSKFKVFIDSSIDSLYYSDQVKQLKKASKSEISFTRDLETASLIISCDQKIGQKYGATKELEKSREGFLIKQVQNSIIIYAPNKLGVQHGLYYYLEQLGFRWFLPNEIWTIHPEEINYNLTINSDIIIPDFKSREFFGSGGLVINHQIDPTNIRKKDWELWKRRNRMGGSRKIWGHQWQAFLKREKKEINAHPEYLAEINGERVKNKPSSKLCISNNQLVSLFVQDRINQFEQNLKKHGKEHLLGRSIGVEPSDGGGHCTCTACLEIGSISTRVFYLANVVAEEITKKYPWVLVSMLAYNKHADTPDLDIHPSVDVTIIPRGFHNVAPGPIYLKKWQDKLKRPLGMYDYWSIPIWRLDLPGFDIFHVDKKLKSWNIYGIDALLMESSYSSGSIGLALYQMAQIGWDKNLSSEKILSEYFALSFGPAQVPMERMLRRWSNGYKGLLEIPFALEDLKEADQLAKTAEQKLRINAWKEYVHFVKLMTEFKELPKKSEERIAKADQTFAYMWQTYWNYMAHPNYTQFAITHHHEKQQVLQVKWSLRKDKMDPAFWKRWKNAENIDKLISADAIGYPLQFKTKNFKKNYSRSTPFTPPNTSKSESIKIKTAKSHNLTLYLNAQEELSLPYSILNPREGLASASFLVTDLETTKVYDYSNLIAKRESISTYNFKAPKSGFYDVSLSVAKCRLELEFDYNMAIAFQQYPAQTQKFRNLFIPIPKDSKEVIFSASKELIFKSPKGREIPIEALGNDLYKLVLPDVIPYVQFQEKSSIVEFHNIPNLFFLFPNKMFLYE